VDDVVRGLWNGVTEDRHWRGTEAGKCVDTKDAGNGDGAAKGQDPFERLVDSLDVCCPGSRVIIVHHNKPQHDTHGLRSPPQLLEDLDLVRLHSASSLWRRQPRATTTLINVVIPYTSPLYWNYYL
jgi:hypothetical protein